MLSFYYKLLLLTSTFLSFYPSFFLSHVSFNQFKSYCGCALCRIVGFFISHFCSTPFLSCCLCIYIHPSSVLWALFIPALSCGLSALLLPLRILLLLCLRQTIFWTSKVFLCVKLCHVQERESLSLNWEQAQSTALRLCGVQPSDLHIPVITWVIVSCFS